MATEPRTITCEASSLGNGRTLVERNRRLIAEIRASRPEQERMARRARDGFRQAVAMLRRAA